jgi:hypothetical protein
VRAPHPVSTAQQRVRSALASCEVPPWTWPSAVVFAFDMPCCSECSMLRAAVAVAARLGCLWG